MDLGMLGYVKACEHFRWHLETWSKSTPEDHKFFPFRCRSWRHEGECRLWKGAQDFVRIKEAMLARRHWSHLTLTYDPLDWPDRRKLFRLSVHHWSILRKRLVREYKDIKYIQTWEQHASGYLHVHIAISNREIWQMLGPDRKKNFFDYFQADAMAAGFGKQGTIDAIRSKGRMANYLTKKAKELIDGSVKGQLPLDAPPHFRRLRASVRLLPPVVKNEDITGALHFCRVDNSEIIEKPE